MIKQLFARLLVLSLGRTALLLFLATAIAGCGDFTTVAAKSISGAAQTLVALKDGLVDYDKLHGPALLDDAASRAEFDAKFATYRKVRDKIAVGILEAQKVLLVAARALLLVYAGMADPSALVKPVADLAAAVADLVLSFTKLQAPSAPGGP